MDMNLLKGRVFNQTTIGYKDDDGYWKVEVSMTEMISLDGETWAEEKIETMAMDRSFNDAHKLALKSALAELQEVVYARGFDSLITGRAYQNSLGEADATSKPDQDTPTL